MEKHINSIFSKLDLAEEPDVNRRVKAVLVYLAAGGGWLHHRRVAGWHGSARQRRGDDDDIDADIEGPSRMAARRPSA